MDRTRLMMPYTNLPTYFLGEALLTATYILHRVEYIAKSLAPYEIWTKHKSDLSKLKA